jgi:hypothetical protein
MRSDVQWTAVQLLLCPCCTGIVGVDVTGCIVSIQQYKKKKVRNRYLFFTLYDELREDENKFLNYFRMSVSSFDELHRRLKESLQRRNRKIRSSILAVEMLAVAIR